MKPMLKRVTATLTGDRASLAGNVTGLRGNVTDLRGDVDHCALTANDRVCGVEIYTLIQP